MHIAIDARIINSSTGRYVERLLTYLERQDSPHTYSVIVRAEDVDYWKPTKTNFKVVVANYANYSLGEQIRFYFFLRRLHADLVHFCMPQQPWLYRRRKVTTVHDLNLIRIKQKDGMNKFKLRFRRAVFKKLLRSVIRKSKYIITPTEYTKQDLLKFKKKNPDHVVVTYESADKLANKLVPIKRYEGVSYLLYVGRSEEYKNIRGLIKAHKRLRKTHPKLRLVICGKRDDNSKAIEEWAYDKGYRNIDFYGFAEDRELAWLFSNCAAFVWPTFMEGFGLPPLEAMRHKAPVASSNATCLPEVLGSAAIYFDPSDIKDMATKIDAILTSKKIRTTLIARGTKQVSKYSWDKMARETLEVYNRALEI